MGYIGPMYRHGAPMFLPFLFACIKTALVARP